MKQQTPEQQSNEKQQLNIGIVIFLVFISLETLLVLLRWRGGWACSSIQELFSVGVILNISSYLLLTGFTIEAVVKRQPNAIAWCKSAACYIAIDSFLALIISNFDNIDYNAIHRLFAFLVSIFWMLYFRFSKKINSIFPKEGRSISTLFVVIQVCLYILIFISAFYVRNNFQNHESSFSKIEYTDGIIALSIPDGYYCIEKTETERTIFLVNTNKCEVMVYGGIIQNLADQDLTEIANSLFNDLQEKLKLEGEVTNTFTTFTQREKIYEFHRKYAYSSTIDVSGPMELDAYVLFVEGADKYAVVYEIHPQNFSESKVDSVSQFIRFK